MAWKVCLDVTVFFKASIQILVHTNEEYGDYDWLYNFLKRACKYEQWSEKQGNLVAGDG